jgi:tripartite-type tricarboxylate transporter receptor subunit TctC
MEELGYPFASIVEYGFTVRAGTPEEVRKKLEDTLKKVVNDPEVKSKLESMGLTPRFIDGKQYGEIVMKAVKSVPELIQYSKKAQEG